MGDGPGYDAMYARIDEERHKLLRARYLRYHMLLAILRSTGFGYCNAIGVDAMVRDKLQEALDILSAIEKEKPTKEERELHKFIGA